MKIKNVTVKKIIVAKNVKTLAPNAVMMDTFMMAIPGVGCVYLGDLEAGVGHGVPHHGHDLGGELPLLLPGCIYTS